MRQEENGQKWVRRYIRATAEDGDVRVKTALRVAGAISNTEKADLYQVVLLDEVGPAQRADMRGRAIGAEVLFSREPGKISGMTAPFQASYADGLAAENGDFYGDRKTLSIDEIKNALRDVAKSEVEIDLQVDPSLIGSLVVKMGSRMVDASLRTKLNTIRLAMREAR